MSVFIRIVVFVILFAAVGAVIWLGVENVKLRKAESPTPVSRETAGEVVSHPDHIDVPGDTVSVDAVQRMEAFYAQRQNTEPDLGIVDEDLRNDLANRRKKERFMAQFEPDGQPVGPDHYITQKFGPDHRAVDYAAPEGDDVYAVASGVVRDVFSDRYYGNVMIVDHLNGYASLYAHLEDMHQSPGQFVEKGHAIASVGNTGNSTAPHLHLEIWSDGVRVDPMKLITDN